MFILDILKSVQDVLGDYFAYAAIYEGGVGVLRDRHGDPQFVVDFYDRDSSYDDAGKWFCRRFGYVEEKK